MSQTATNFEAPRTKTSSPAAASKPFAGLIDAVLVGEPAALAFPGAVSRSLAATIWTWVVRDLCADLISTEGVANNNFGPNDLEPLVPQVLKRIKDSLAQADVDADAARRLLVTLGNETTRAAIPVVLSALRNRALLVKAQAFGRAVNTITDEAALGMAIQSMPLQDPTQAALLFQAAIGQVANPTRIITTVIKLSGNATEVSIARGGFGPVIDAILAHAQHHISPIQPMGPFADIDLICRSLDRFHRLIRSLSGNIEFSRGSRWATAISVITKQASDRIEPRLKNVVPDVNLALRRGREGSDRADNDALLSALNGIYLLGTIRECRDSLALNALFDQAWSQSGQALEMYLQRNLDLIRQNPGDDATAARLDTGIKMAEIRFNPEYADTLRRARAAAERRS